MSNKTIACLWQYSHKTEGCKLSLFAFLVACSMQVTCISSGELITIEIILKLMLATAITHSHVEHMYINFITPFQICTWLRNSPNFRKLYVFFSFSSMSGGTWCLQVMLLRKWLQLPLPVLVIPSPSGALLLGTWMESLSGEWMGVVSVSWYTEQIPLFFVGQVIPSQPCQELDLEQVAHLSHQSWVALHFLLSMVYWLSALDQPSLQTQGTGLETVHSRY